MNTTKVHVITEFFYPVRAGIETHCLELYKRLKNSFDITIHTSRSTLLEKNILNDFEMIEGLRIKKYRSLPIGFVPKSACNGAIVHLHNFNVFPHFWVFMNALARRGKKEKSKLIVTTHGGFTPYWSNFSPLTMCVKKIYNRTFGRFALNYLTDAIIAVSDWEKRQMCKEGVNPGKIVVMRNGIEDLAFENEERKVSDKFKMQVKDFGQYVIQIGRVNPIKNQGTMIRALSHLPNLKYLIVGTIQDGDYYEECRRLARELDVENRVVFFGEVSSPEEKFYLLKNAFCYVHLAQWEADPIAVKEGMSQGLVCIVSNRGELPYLVKDQENGFVVRDFEDSVNKIGLVLNPKNKVAVERISRNNTSKSQMFKWDETAKRVKEIYDAIRPNALNA
jgi:glycosyltransferase involved in cell wall biosynthesis